MDRLPAGREAISSLWIGSRRVREAIRSLWIGSRRVRGAIEAVPIGSRRVRERPARGMILHERMRQVAGTAAHTAPVPG
jgi:hypothetical protein